MSANMQSMQTKREKTHRMVLDAAAKLFSEQGYHGTSLKSIAEAVNMQAGSLYYHFSSKDQLMQDVLNKSIYIIYSTVKTEMNKLDEAASFSDKLKAAIRGHMIAILTYADYTSASIRNYGQLPDAVHYASQPARDEYEQFWRALFEQAEIAGAIRADVDKHLLRLSIFGSMNWSSVWFNAQQNTSVEALAAAQADIFLHGCLKQGQNR